MSDHNLQPPSPPAARRVPRLALALAALGLLALAGVALLAGPALWRAAPDAPATAATAPQPADEMVILVLPFGGAVRDGDTPVQQRLAQALEAQRGLLGEGRVRVIAPPESELRPGELDQPGVAGRRYGAVLTVAGTDTGRRIAVGMHAQATPEESAQATPAPPDDGSPLKGFVTQDLAGHTQLLTLFALGYAAYFQDDHTPALRAVAQAAAQLDGMANPPQGSAVVYFMLGVLHEEVAADYQQAEAAYDQAIRLEPDSSDIFLHRGYARDKQGDLLGALDDYSEAIDLNPQQAHAYYNRGVIRLAQSDPEGAIDDFSAAIDLDPEYVLAYNNRGSLRSQQGNLEGALADYEQVIRLDPQNPGGYNGRGVAYAKQGDRKRAIVDFDEAIRLDPQYAVAYYNRALARDAQGNREGALADYDQAIQLNPDYTNALYNRAALRQRMDDTAGAADDYRRVRDLSEPGTSDYEGAETALRRLGFDR